MEIFIITRILASGGEGFDSDFSTAFPDKLNEDKETNNKYKSEKLSEL